MAAEKMLVRLKPYDPKRRHVMQTYTHGPSGLRFEGARGWYRVDAAIAAYLARVPQVPGDPDSPMAFDVVTEDQGREMEEQEERARDRKASAAAPNEATLDRTPTDLTTYDLQQRGYGHTEPQTRADAPSPGLRRDGAVEPGKPPHYAADDPRGFRRLVHREDLPDIEAPIPGPPPVVGAIAGARRATVDEPHEPVPLPPAPPPGAGPPQGALAAGYPPPGYGDPDALKAHFEKTEEQLKASREREEKSDKAAAAGGAKASGSPPQGQQPGHSKHPPPPGKDEK